MSNKAIRVLLAVCAVFNSQSSGSQTQLDQRFTSCLTESENELFGAQ